MKYKPTSFCRPSSRVALSAVPTLQQTMEYHFEHCPPLCSTSQSVLIATCATTWPGVDACTSGVPSVPTSSAAGAGAPSRMERYLFSLKCIHSSLVTRRSYSSVCNTNLVKPDQCSWTSGGHPQFFPCMSISHSLDITIEVGQCDPSSVS